MKREFTCIIPVSDFAGKGLFTGIVRSVRVRVLYRWGRVWRGGHTAASSSAYSPGEQRTRVQSTPNNLLHVCTTRALSTLRVWLPVPYCLHNRGRQVAKCTKGVESLMQVPVAKSKAL